MSAHNHVNEVLAEVQFAFICFLVGQHYDSFEQWKNLLIMLCSCDDALTKYPDLFSCLITDIYFQIKEVPEDFFCGHCVLQQLLSIDTNDLLLQRPRLLLLTRER
eukprot:TRINITY_DN6939_c0_g1_i2.p1 TRINITY_DN6939_c0_g1~~TRINITY_DN6939_c0_g1_i2.p1  ORF type:complete len:105 (-),score=11.21 TRINITY_DN6939_c0_g1_i2:283-597(-)